MKQESKKYHDTKPGSIQDTVAQMYANEQKSVTIKVDKLSELIETYLNKGGVSHNLSPVIAEKKLNEVLPLQAVREFIDTYNRHFLTNYAAEEFVVETQTQEGGPGSGPQARADKVKTKYGLVGGGIKGTKSLSDLSKAQQKQFNIDYDKAMTGK